MSELQRHVIDCDETPFTPDGWSVHPEDQLAAAVCGKLLFDPKTIVLYLDPAQPPALVLGPIAGDDLAKRLSDKPVLKANVLDYLLNHPELIPDLWKGGGLSRNIYFWGTIYRDSRGNKRIRYLCWDGTSWAWFWSYLSSDFYDRYYAAVFEG